MSRPLASLGLSGAALLALAACQTTEPPPLSRGNYERGAPIVTRTATLPYPPPLPPLSVSRELPPRPTRDARRLSIGSILQVDVAGVEALSTEETRVGADGCVFMPFLGRIRAAKRTPLELGRDLERALTERGYLRDAQVNVTLLREEGEIYVLGQVGRPGAFPLAVGRDLRLSQALAMAGGIRATPGLKPDATAIRLVREVAGRRRSYRISFPEIALRGRLEADVELQSGDVIYVPAQQELFVFGSVNQAGGFFLEEGSRLGVDEVLALAGGFGEKADQDGLLLVRRGQSGVATYQIPSEPIQRSEILLTAGDTLIVPARGLRRVFVLGAVKSQSGIPLDEPDLTVSKALALAGGLNRIAAGNSVLLIRRGPDGKKHTYPVRVADVVRGEPELDPVLEPGDIIFVPEGFF